MRSRRRTILVAVLTGLLVLTACADGDPTGDPADTPDDQVAGDDLAEDDAPAPQDAPTRQRFPDVIDAELEPAGDTWRLSATLSSPYDTPERYSDAFRALTPDGEELGVRVLLHDHANEQPFTRALTDLQIPDDVDTIIVEGRDLEHGWGGETITLEVPRSG